MISQFRIIKLDKTVDASKYITVMVSLNFMG